MSIMSMRDGLVVSGEISPIVGRVPRSVRNVSTYWRLRYAQPGRVLYHHFACMEGAN